jgi:C-terminal processing protease CtpA/Prc
MYSILYPVFLAALVALFSACSTKTPAPAQPPVAASKPPPSPAPSVEVKPSAPPPPAEVDKSLDSILSEYTKKWRNDYPLRMNLAAKCANSRSYSYGMRMLQPATFTGDFAESVQRKYGNTTDFIVIAVGPNSAAAKAGIFTGDRIVQVGTVKSTQANAGKTLAERSRKWSKPYEVVLLKNSKPVTVTLTPDAICEIPL